MLAAIIEAIDTPIPMMLFHRHQRVKHIATLHRPTRVVKDYAPKRLIAYDPIINYYRRYSDDWCLEYLRFM